MGHGRRLLVGLLAAVVAACGGGGDDSSPQPNAEDGLRVASFNFVESEVLAELYAQAVESAGVPVVRLGAVGPREIVMPALELGLIDLVPEYLGTSLRRFGVDASPDTAVALAELDARLEPLELTALAAAPAEDKNVVVVSSTTAARDGLESISDLAPLAASFRFGGPPECPDRPLCLLGLQDVYGLQFAEFVSQRSNDFTAEALRRDQIDVGLMFSTDPALASSDLTVLADDLRLQPAENIVPVMRLSALARWGTEVPAALDAVSAKLTTRSLLDLNRRVDEGEPVERVAADWLDANQLPAG